MRRLLFIGLLGTTLAGCVTPSIPIPPPDPAKMTFTLAGTAGDQTASFTYEAEQNYASATVFVFNRIKGVGIITTANDDGSVDMTAPVAANLGDEIVVTFQHDEQTASKCIKLREGQQSSTDFCGP